MTNLYNLKSKQVKVTHLVNNAGFLKQILLNLGTFYWSAGVKVNIDIFAESARVVIPNCFRISKC